MSLHALPEFAQGLFELQSESAQIVCESLELQAGMKVMDYGAGAGSRALALLPRLRDRGTYLLVDPSPDRLSQNRTRLRRVQAGNVQFAEGLGAARAHGGRMDLVIVGPPSTPTAALRRQPEEKLAFSQGRINALIGAQQDALRTGAAFVRPGGELCYLTRSLLAAENFDQLKVFLSHNRDFELTARETHLPATGDGCFVARLRRCAIKR